MMQLTFADQLALKPRGWFRIARDGDRIVITAHRPSGVEHIHCLSWGHANQTWQALSDERLTGLVEYA